MGDETPSTIDLLVAITQLSGKFDGLAMRLDGKIEQHGREIADLRTRHEVDNSDHETRMRSVEERAAKIPASAMVTWKSLGVIIGLLIPLVGIYVQVLLAILYKQPTLP